MQRLFRTIAVSVAAVLVVGTLPVAHAAEPFGSTACAGVRPGAWIEAPRNTVYTMGFLLKGTDAKGTSANYITTVGTHVLTSFGTKVWTPQAGPQAFDQLGKPIGRFVYAVHTSTPEFTTFGLVQLDTKIKPNPQVCHFGGPTGVYERVDLAPRTVEYYGNGFPVDSVSPARTATATGTANETIVFVQGAVTWGADTGDEGAPVLADGKAIGFYDGGVGIGGEGPGGAGFIVSRIGPWVSRAQKALRVKLDLRRAVRL